MAPRRSYRLRVDPSPRAGIRHQRTQHRMVELRAASYGAVRGKQGAARERQIADRVQDLVADEFVGETLAFRIEDAVIADNERVLERGAERIARVPQRGHVAHETEGTCARNFAPERVRFEVDRERLASDQGMVELDLRFNAEAARVGTQFAEGVAHRNLNRLEHLEVAP